MSVYLKDDLVLLDSGSVATSADCCCGGVTGACCVNGECSIETEADCENMSGVYQGDGSDCDPNPCVCLSSPTNVTFSGVTAPECCVGGGNEYVFPSTDIFAININRGAGFDFEPCLFPLIGNKCWGFLWGTEGLPYVVSDNLTFSTEDCSDTPGLNVDNAFSLFVDCNHGQSDYSELPLGWFIVAWGVRPWFAAFGLSDLDIISPVNNQLTCGVQDSNCATFGAFVGGLSESVGEGGTATLT